MARQTFSFTADTKAVEKMRKYMGALTALDGRRRSLSDLIECAIEYYVEQNPIDVAKALQEDA